MTIFRIALLAVLLAIPFRLASTADTQRRDPAPRPPNVVIVFADDLGYADVNRFGPPARTPWPRTPNIDRMAAEGVRLTSFYVAQAVCSASRAALLTGAYPNRVGITGALNHTATHGLNPDEITIAEVLKERGYATAIFGKWHLVTNSRFCRCGKDSTNTSACRTRTTCGPGIPSERPFFPSCR